MTNKNDDFVKKLCFGCYCVRNFLWWGVRCDTSNRLLRNSSRDRLGGFRVVSRWCPWVILSHENTCSEYRIPPQNTPRKIDEQVINQEVIKMKRNTKLLDSDLFIDLSMGVFWGGIRYSLPPTHPPEIPNFFPFFPDFYGISGVSPIKPTYIWDFWGPGGGG